MPITYSIYYKYYKFVVLLLPLAWPGLSCVYCTGKVPGWFFRHEISDLGIKFGQLVCVSITLS